MKRAAVEDPTDGESKRLRETPLDFHMVVRCWDGGMQLYDKCHKEVASFDRTRGAHYEACLSYSIALGRNQEIFVNDTECNRIIVMNRWKKIIKSFYLDGEPSSVRYDAPRDVLIVTLFDRDRILIMHPETGRVLGGYDCLKNPRGAALTKKPHLVVHNSYELQVSCGSTVLYYIGTGVPWTIGSMVIDEDDRIIVFNTRKATLEVFNETLQLIKCVHIDVTRDMKYMLALDVNRVYVPDFVMSKVSAFDLDTGTHLLSFDVLAPICVSFAPKQCWRDWNPIRGEVALIAPLFKAWRIARLKGEGSLSLLTPDFVVHELCQFLFNTAPPPK